jgi:hypothetical protein
MRRQSGECLHGAMNNGTDDSSKNCTFSRGRLGFLVSEDRSYPCPSVKFVVKNSSFFRVLSRDSRFKFLLAPVERENFNHKRHRNHKISDIFIFVSFVLSVVKKSSSSFRVHSRDSRFKFFLMQVKKEF